MNLTYLALCIALPLVINAQQEERISASQEERVPLKLPLERIVIHNEKGVIRMRPIKEGEIPTLCVEKKHFDPKYHSFKMVEKEGKLELKSGRKKTKMEAAPCEVCYDLRVPEDVSFHWDQGQGVFDFEAIKGSAVLNLGQGEIESSASAGKLDIKLGQGKIKLEKVSSSLKVDLGQGDISVSCVPQRDAVLDVNLELGQGDITINVPEGTRVASKMRLSPIVCECQGQFESQKPQVRLKGSLGTGKLRLVRKG